MKKIKIVFLTILLTFFILITHTILRQPPTNKNWNDEGLILSQINISTSTVQIDNIKNFSYGKTDKNILLIIMIKLFRSSKLKMSSF